MALVNSSVITDLQLVKIYCCYLPQTKRNREQVPFLVVFSVFLLSKHSSFTTAKFRPFAKMPGSSAPFFQDNFCDKCCVDRLPTRSRDPENSIEPRPETSIVICANYPEINCIIGRVGDNCRVLGSKIAGYNWETF